MALEYAKEEMDSYLLYAVSTDIFEQIVSRSLKRVKELPQYRRLHKVASIHPGNLGLTHVKTILIRRNCEYFIVEHDSFAILHRIKHGRGMVKQNPNIIISMEELETIRHMETHEDDMEVRLKFYRPL